MLDTLTLRVCFAVVALTLVVLFYLAAYRTTRSAYSGWWCVSLLLFVLGSAAYLLDGTAMQVWANPFGNLLVVAGTASVWAAARSLRTARPSRWQLALLPVLVGAVSLLDDPATNEWSGGEVFLPAVALLLALAAVELWRFRADAPAAVATAPSSLPTVVLVMTVVSAATSAFYAARAVVFWLHGPYSTEFTVVFGSQSTTLVLIVLLAVVSFSMSSISNEQRTSDLRDRATRDGLTGLLNRDEFLRRADVEMRRLHRDGRAGAVVVADLDHFKRINDEHGHEAGDVVLRAFAQACRDAVRDADLVCRWGGEEFVLMLPGASPTRAEEVTAVVGRRMAAALGRAGHRAPTASYGIVGTGTSAPPDASVTDLVARADAAMYRAKAAGRDRVEHAEPSR